MQRRPPPAQSPRCKAPPPTSARITRTGAATPLHISWAGLLPVAAKVRKALAISRNLASGWAQEETRRRHCPVRKNRTSDPALHFSWASASGKASLACTNKSGRFVALAACIRYRRNTQSRSHETPRLVTSVAPLRRLHLEAEDLRASELKKCGTLSRRAQLEIPRPAEGSSDLLLLWPRRSGPCSWHSGTTSSKKCEKAGLILPRAEPVHCSAAARHCAVRPGSPIRPAAIHTEVGAFLGLIQSTLASTRSAQQSSGLLTMCYLILGRRIRDSCNSPECLLSLMAHGCLEAEQPNSFAFSESPQATPPFIGKVFTVRCREVLPRILTCREGIAEF